MNLEGEGAGLCGFGEVFAGALLVVRVKLDTVSQLHVCAAFTCTEAQNEGKSRYL